MCDKMSPMTPLPPLKKNVAEGHDARVYTDTFSTCLQQQQKPTFTAAKMWQVETDRKNKKKQSERSEAIFKPNVISIFLSRF